MSMHTPGVWKVSFPYVVAADARETIVCEVTGGESNDAAQADARLIAAAPDLLAALRRALNAHDGDWQNGQSWEQMARAAIARAEGK